MDILYTENDNLLTLDKLYNNDPNVDDYVNDATVTVTLKDSDDSEVSGQTWPTTLSYVSGSNGKYVATLEDDLSLTADANYTAEVNVDAGSDIIAKFYLELIARKRTG
jgi:hypothetical protein